MTLNLYPDKVPKKNILLFVVLTLLLTIMVAPFKLTVAEKRVFRVVDSKGIPVTEAIIRQHFRQYSIDYRSEVIEKTDADGYVFLPERAITARVVDLVSGALKNILEYTINAGIGSYDFVVVYADGYEVRSFTNGNGLESKIVVLKKK